MIQFSKISNLIILGLLIIICMLGTFYKHISFGLGLGDIFYYLILYLGTLTHLILTILIRKKRSLYHIILSLVFCFFIIIIILKATLWRGDQYSWNGSVFYLPCPTEITIDNLETKKEKLITMCTMDYYSEFSGNWNGQLLTIKSGEIKIPEELEEFINMPITKVQIESDFNEIFENNKRRKEFYFEKDTLQINHKYILKGEILAVKNRIPVIKVKIVN